MTRKLKTIATLAAALAATSALAATQIDMNGDGLLTIDELTAVYPDVTEAQFLQADVDANGLIDEAELAAARDAGLIPPDQG